MKNPRIYFLSAFSPIVILIVTNLFQFPLIREEASKQYGTWAAFRRLSNPSVFNPAVISANESKITLSRFEIYWTLGQAAPNSLVLTEEDSDFKPGSSAFSNLLALGKVRGIKTVSNLPDVTIPKKSLKPHATYSGIHWESSLHRTSGKPPINWEIHVHQQRPPTTLIFISDQDSSRWQFIDIKIWPFDLYNQLSSR